MKSWPDSLIKWASRRQPALELLGLVVLFAIFGVILWKVPQLQTPPGLADPQAQANFENEARRIIAQILLGALVLAGLYFTWRRVRASDQTVEVSREQQITERFTRAIEQLGSDKLAIRLGGIYALERIAKDSPDKDHWQVMEVLTAYVRENACRVEPSEGDSASEEGEETESRVPIDIQAILTVLGRRDSTYERPDQRLDLSGTSLAWANLVGADLARANFFLADLAGVYLFGANLEGASLYETNLEETYLPSTNLAGARGLTQEQVDSAIIDALTILPDYLRKNQREGQSL
jgi:hypothetical protein